MFQGSKFLVCSRVFNKASNIAVKASLTISIFKMRSDSDIPGFLVTDVRLREIR